MQANLAIVTQKVKGQLGCIVSENEEMDKKLDALNIKMKVGSGRLREDGTLVLMAM